MLPHINHLFTADYVLVEAWKHRKRFFLPVTVFLRFMEKTDGCIFIATNGTD